MNYKDAINFLFNSLPVWERVGAKAYKPGLERIAEFAARLGNPQESFASVHVAGTNGKGSTCHMLAAVLTSAGCRTGLFTSPHLVDFRERIRVDGEMIPEQAVVEFTERWQGEPVSSGLSFFEMTTAMALWWFARTECDAAIIETGLGGRLDSTNIITPRVSVITNIALEHTQYLGSTIAAIAAEKAGIIKPGVPVVIGETDPESAPVFRARAAELDSEIVFADESNHASHVANHTLTGDYRQKNRATVRATVDVLRRTFTIPDEAVRRGINNGFAMTGLRGRWEIIDHAPLTVLDTAHNAHGIAEAMRMIARQRYDRLYMVLGFAADKDLDAIIALLPRDAHYILTQAATPRALPADDLALRLVESGKLKASSTEKTVSQAVKKARMLAGPRDMIFIGGSNFVVGEALAFLS